MDGTFYGYHIKKKLSNGQTATILFFKNDRIKFVEYSVTLLIANKKKDIRQLLLGERDVLTDKITGRGGIEGLLWARKMLSKFENMISQQLISSKISVVWIIIYASDSKRKKAYIRGLKNLGYIFGIRDCVECIYKKIVKVD